MDPREQPFADIMDSVDFDSEPIEGEVVDEETEVESPEASEPAQLDIQALMQEAFGSL